MPHSWTPETIKCLKAILNVFFGCNCDLLKYTSYILYSIKLLSPSMYVLVCVWCSVILVPSIFLCQSEFHKKNAGIYNNYGDPTGRTKVNRIILVNSMLGMGGWLCHAKATVQLNRRTNKTKCVMWMWDIPTILPCTIFLEFFVIKLYSLWHQRLRDTFSPHFGFHSRERASCREWIFCLE